MSNTKDEFAKERTLLAGNMWAVYNFGSPNERYSKFLTRGRPAFKSLIEAILLYEKIFVPTQDFLSLTILVGVLGERAIIHLLETDRLKFLRFKGALAYIGNGVGIEFVEAIKSPEGVPQPFCAPLEMAINWSLDGLNEKAKDPVLRNLAIDATHEIDIKPLVDEIRHETYMDLLKSAYLRSVFALHNRDVNKLTGIEPNGVRIHGGPDGNWKGDEIDIVMALSATNLELRLAQLINSSDASMASPVGHLLRAKAQRSLGKLTGEQSFAVLREIAEIPDFGEGVIEKQISVAQIIKLSQSRNCTQFREWFHENCQEDPIRIAREYAALLREIPRVQSLPAKVIRFITTSLIGYVPIVGQVAGVIASVIDSFFVEQCLHGGSPKFFIEDLRQFQGKPKNQVASKKGR